MLSAAGKCAVETCPLFDYWHYPVLVKDWYKDWPSFRWELPLFLWFLGLALIVGIAFGIALKAMHGTGPPELLLWSIEGGSHSD